MSLVGTGTIGLDTVETPFGKAEDVLGGSMVYFSISASLFTMVRLVGVVGEDFPDQHRAVFAKREIDLAGLETRAGSKTFRWAGKYEGDMNEAETVSIDLNVIAEQAPKVPDAYRDSEYVFLAATHPALQQSMVKEFPNAQLVVCDTRDFWIDAEKAELAKTLSLVGGVVLNDGEARMFTGETNLITAGRRILGFGPKFVIIKKGEHGAMLCTKEAVVTLPSFPTDKVKDPTGAGDSFAGGMMGYLAGIGKFEVGQLRRAMAYGTITASFTIEDFSLRGIETVNRTMVDERLAQYTQMLTFG
ncbi:MAG: sugar kinase [Planctomycetes bacterium]|nr:sugar kinase [Planctomycetota bacterium]